MQSPYWTVPCLNREMTQQPTWKYVQLTLGKSSPSRQKLSPSWFIIPFKAALPKNISKNNCQMSHMHLVLTGNREVGVPSPGANLVQLARGGFCNSPLRWSRFTLMLNDSQQSLLTWSWDMLFSHESDKSKKMRVIFEWDPAFTWLQHHGVV